MSRFATAKQLIRRQTHVHLRRSRRERRCRQGIRTRPFLPDVTLTPVTEWKVLGTPLLRPNSRDIVTGAHKYPSDISRPGMLYGKVLRPPSFGAKLTSIDVAPAKAMKGVIVAQDDSFVGVIAPTSFLAQDALDAIAKTAKWETVSHPSSKELFDYLKQHAEGGVPTNPFADELPKAAKVLRPKLPGRLTRNTRRSNRAPPLPNGRMAN